MKDLESRFRQECPKVSLEYVKANLPELASVARKYLRLRPIAQTHADIDALVIMRKQLEGADK